MEKVGPVYYHNLENGISPATRLGKDQFGDSQVSISCIGLCTAILLIGVSMLQQAEVCVIKLLEEKQEELHLVRFFLKGSSYPRQLSNLPKVFASADQVTITIYLANKAVERLLTHVLEDCSHAVTQKLIEYSHCIEQCDGCGLVQVHN